MDQLQKALGLAPKIQAMNKVIAAQFVDRAQIALAFWLAVISDRASFLLGPPGVAKTAVTQFLSKLVTGMVFYEELMPVVVSPEQLLVAETSLTERELPGGGKAVSVTNKLGLAAAAHFVALDEIWKSQPAVLKSLFDLLLADGVRLGGVFHETPTLGVMAASNELPEPGNQLEALWARMAFRFYVRPLDRAGKLRMLQLRREQDGNDKTPPPQSLTLEDLHTLQAARRLVTISDDAFTCVLNVYEALVKQDQAAFQWLWDDDRRLDIVREGLQAHALMNGRGAVSKADLAVLRYMLWDTPEQIPIVEGVIAPYIRTPVSEAKELIDALFAAGGAVKTAFESGQANSGATNAMAQVRELCDNTLPSLRANADASEQAQIQAWIGAMTSFKSKLAQRMAGIDVGTWEDATRALN